MPDEATAAATATALTGGASAAGVAPIFASAAALSSALAAEGLVGVTVSAIESAPVARGVEIDVVPPAAPSPARTRRRGGAATEILHGPPAPAMGGKARMQRRRPRRARHSGVCGALGIEGGPVPRPELRDRRGLS